MKSLGQELEAILNLNTEASGQGSRTLTFVPITQVIPGQFQVYRHFDQVALNELAVSIKEQGIIQPLIVKREGSNYVIIAGEKRWRAAQIASLFEVPIIESDISHQAAMAFSVIESLQRSDINAIEEACAYLRLATEFAMTHAEVAKMVGKSRTQVSNHMRLLNLTDTIKKYVINAEIDMAHARCLASLLPLEQDTFAKKIINEKLSVRQVEKLIQTTRRRQSHLPDNIQEKLFILQQTYFQKINVKKMKNNEFEVLISGISEQQLMQYLDELLALNAVSENEIKKLNNVEPAR